MLPHVYVLSVATQQSTIALIAGDEGNDRAGVKLCILRFLHTGYAALRCHARRAAPQRSASSVNESLVP